MSTDNASILVTGGTGTLGRHVVRLLRDAGRPVRILSRGAREPLDGVEFVQADLQRDDGLARAIDGAHTVFHLAGSGKGDDWLAANLVNAAKEAGVRHIVYISVVGADRVPITGALDRMMFGYFGDKRAAERIIEESGIPWTTMRASQFHDLLLTMSEQMSRMPLIPVFRGFRFQPVDAAEVAARLVALGLAQPAGLVADFAGPRVYAMDELIRSYLNARGRRRAIVRIPPPGAAARAFRDGANLSPQHAVGRRTWEEFLAERVSQG